MADHGLIFLQFDTAWDFQEIIHLSWNYFLSLPLRHHKPNEKKTVNNWNPLHAGVKAPAHAGIFFVSEELCR